MIAGGDVGARASDTTTSLLGGRRVEVGLEFTFGSKIWYRSTFNRYESYTLTVLVTIPVTVPVTVPVSLG